MINAAAMHGIDLSLMWGTVDRAPDGRATRVREVCLAVPGSGKTAVLLLGEPTGIKPSPGDGHPERVACIRAACEHLKGRVLSLAQTLPEPKQTWAIQAFGDAGFTRVGDLAYMKRGVQALSAGAGGGWPTDISVRNVRGGPGQGPSAEDHALLIEALDRSYEDTLDCPELCGLRQTSDVLESHRATGEWNAGLWWLVLMDGRPHGCMMFNRVPDQGSVELVYLGISREIRGRGLGARLLEVGLEGAIRTDASQITCAVDLRNGPALRLYARFGFSEFGRRVAMVRPLGSPA